MKTKAWLFLCCWLCQPLAFAGGMSQSAIKGLADCRSIPPFTKRLGFNPNSSAFSTTDRLHMGLVYTEISQSKPTNPATTQNKLYQHPSWSTAGYLGPMVIDHGGIIYVAPLPTINLDRNDPSKQNMLYQVNPDTGEMSAYLSLPTDFPPNSQNPFGILGLGYDCQTKIIYASSVQGSNRQQELGRIYAISTGASPHIIDKIADLDGFGMGIGIINGKKKLVFGKARTSDLFALEIGADGRFIGKPEWVLSLYGLGVRGDDHARKIRFTETGDLVVHGVEFYFNLTAPTEVQQTSYTFRYDAQKTKWLLVSQSSR